MKHPSTHDGGPQLFYRPSSLILSSVLPSSLLAIRNQPLATQQNPTPSQLCTGSLKWFRHISSKAPLGTDMKLTVNGLVALVSNRVLVKTAHAPIPPQRVKNQKKGTSRK